MNRENHIRSIKGMLGLAALVAAGAAAAAEELPLPSFVYYGEVVDAYGWPLKAADKAYVIARLGSCECGRSLVHEGRGPAINYRVEVPLRNNQAATNSAGAARIGDTLVFSVQVGGIEHPVLHPQAIPLVGQPGGIVRHNLGLGTDVDADGLPDEWENWIIAWSGGAFTNIVQVRGSDDFDGDGVSNLDEFLSGTDPAWDASALRIEEINLATATGRIGIAFHSVPGKTYRVFSAGAVQDPFVASALATGPLAALGNDYWRGDGSYSWLYLEPPAGAPLYFLRLNAE